MDKGMKGNPMTQPLPEWINKAADDICCAVDDPRTGSRNTPRDDVAHIIAKHLPATAPDERLRKAALEEAAAICQSHADRFRESSEGFGGAWTVKASEECRDLILAALSSTPSDERGEGEIPCPTCGKPTVQEANSFECYRCRQCWPRGHGWETRWAEDHSGPTVNPSPLQKVREALEETIKDYREHYPTLADNPSMSCNFYTKCLEALALLPQGVSEDTADKARLKWLSDFLSGPDSQYKRIARASNGKWFISFVRQITAGHDTMNEAIDAARQSAGGGK